MSKPVNIGSVVFPSKGKAKDFFRDMRDAYAAGDRISDEHSQYLHDLLSIHSEMDAKIGCGISHFTVATASRVGSTRHFVIHRFDDSKTDFSFINAIDGPNPRRDRIEALRRAIEPQIRAFLKHCFATGHPHHICPLRNVPITKDSYHVDHTPPNEFRKLVDTWLNELGIQLGDVAITPPQDNQIVAQMTDTVQIARWTAYHKDNAVLRLLSPRANLSDVKRDRTQ